MMTSSDSNDNRGRQEHARKNASQACYLMMRSKKESRCDPVPSLCDDNQFCDSVVELDSTLC